MASDLGPLQEGLGSRAQGSSLPTWAFRVSQVPYKCPDPRTSPSPEDTEEGKNVSLEHL